MCSDFLFLFLHCFQLLHDLWTVCLLYLGPFIFLYVTIWGPPSDGPVPLEHRSAGFCWVWPCCHCAGSVLICFSSMQFSTKAGNLLLFHKSTLTRLYCQSKRLQLSSALGMNWVNLNPTIAPLNPNLGIIGVSGATLL